MSAITVARFIPVVATRLGALRALLISFIGIELTESVYEGIVNLIEDASEVDGVTIPKGGRGVVMIDLSTGLTLGRTSRRSAIAHLEGKKSAKGRTRTVTKTVCVQCGGNHAHHS